MKMKSLYGVAAVLALLLAAAPSFAALPDAVSLGVAIEVGNIRRARAWLDEGMDPNMEADRIGTGLMIAAWEGNLPMMELFFSRGADIDKVNRHGEQALQLAAWRGRTAAVRWLLERGAKVNREGTGWSALHYAVFAGHKEVASLLLERGADVNARAPNESSVLMMAAREGREDLAKLLVDAGADPQLANDRGDTALTWAMRHGHFRIAKLMSSAAEFASAVKAPPESFGEAKKSVAAPSEITQLLEKIRAAEAKGEPTGALRKALFQAIERFRAEANRAGRKPPKVSRGETLVITASRKGKGERAEVIAAESRPVAPATDTPARLAWNYEESRLGELTELMDRLDEAEKAGRPKPEVAKLRRDVQAAVQRLKGN